MDAWFSCLPFAVHVERRAVQSRGVRLGRRGIALYTSHLHEVEILQLYANEECSTQRDTSENRWKTAQTKNRRVKMTTDPATAYLIT